MARANQIILDFVEKHAGVFVGNPDNTPSMPKATLVGNPGPGTTPAAAPDMNDLGIAKAAFWAGFDKRAGAAAAARSGMAAVNKLKPHIPEMSKKAKELTSKSRDALPDSDFVYPEKRKFPIEDKAHARNALARAHFAPDPEKVRAAVHRKYPDIGKD